MTKPISKDLSHCYSLLFTGDMEARNNRYVRAVLCFEECRKNSQKKSHYDSVFAYCLYRAARKEAQLLIELGAQSRAYRMLRLLDKAGIEGGDEVDRMFILTQLIYLSSKLDRVKVSLYSAKLELLSKAF